MVTPLWVIVVLSFLTGLLPLLAMHRAARWRWRRRLEQSERALADARAAASPSLVGESSPTPAENMAPTPELASPPPGNSHHVPPRPCRPRPPLSYPSPPGGPLRSQPRWQSEP